MFGAASTMQIEETLQESPVPPPGELQHDNSIVNILLLGPTGVGKSSFINSLCNYCLYPSLDEALKGDIQSLIYSEFSTSTVEGDDSEYVYKKVSVGELDNSERPLDGQAGGSCTQECKAYVFPFGESLSIRLIDTPGIADTRGANVDSENMKNVLTFLSQYDVLHAVCILLKPNEVRLTSSLKYSIIKLLEKLHKDASSNILFCFTNSRITNFVAGDTLSLLKEMLQPGSTSTDSVNLKKSFTKKTMYFFDSEAFRFQAMVKNGMTFTGRETEEYGRSWEQSNKEAERLIMHILELKPHYIKDTLSVNHVRSMLESIQKPLGDIAANIQNNLKDIRRVKTNLKQHRGDISNYWGKLYIDEQYQETVALDHPRMICTQPSCKDRICHDKCNPNETALAIAVSVFGKVFEPIRDVIGIPDDGILCTKLSFKSGCCKICGCANDKHVCVNSEMRTTTRKAEDMEIRRVLEDAKSDEEKKAEILEKVEAKEELMKAENNFLLKAAACFAAFLEHNSIVTYHSAVPEYYKEQIKQMRTVGNVDSVAQLEDMLRTYQEREREFKTWQINFQDPSFGPKKQITEKDVDLELQELYKLPLQGPSLKKWAEGLVRVPIVEKGRQEEVFKKQIPTTDHVGRVKDGSHGINLLRRITGAMMEG